MSLNWEKALSYIAEKQDLSKLEQLNLFVTKSETTNLLVFMSENIEEINQIFEDFDSVFTKDDIALKFEDIIKNIIKNPDSIKNINFSKIIVSDNKINNIGKYILETIKNYNGHNYSLFSFCYFMSQQGVSNEIIENFIIENKHLCSDPKFINKIAVNDKDVAQLPLYFLEKMPNLFKDKTYLDGLFCALDNKKTSALNFCVKLKEANILSDEDFYIFLEQVINKFKLSDDLYELYSLSSKLYKGMPKEEQLTIFEKAITKSNNIYNAKDNIIDSLILIKLIYEDKFVKEIEKRKVEKAIEEKRFRIDDRINIDNIKVLIGKIRTNILSNKTNQELTEEDILSDIFVENLSNLSQIDEVVFNSVRSKNKLLDIITDEILESGTLSRKTIKLAIDNMDVSDLANLVYDTIHNSRAFHSKEKKAIYEEIEERIENVCNSASKENPIAVLIDYIDGYKGNKSAQLFIESLEKKLVKIKKEISNEKNKKSIVEQNLEKRVVFNIVKKILDEQMIIDLVNKKVQSLTEENQINLINVVVEECKISSDNFKSVFVDIINQRLNDNQPLNVSEEWIKEVIIDKLKSLPVYQLAQLNEEIERTINNNDYQQRNMIKNMNDMSFNMSFNMYDYPEVLWDKNVDLMHKFLAKEQKSIKDAIVKLTNKKKNLEKQVEDFNDPKLINNIVKMIESLDNQMSIRDKVLDSFIFIYVKSFEYNSKFPEINTSLNISDVNRFWLLKALKEIKDNNSDIDILREASISAQKMISVFNKDTIRSWAEILNISETEISKGIIQYSENKSLLSSIDLNILSTFKLNDPAMWENKDFIFKFTEIIESLNDSKREMMISKTPSKIAKLYKYLNDNDVEDWKRVLREAFIHQTLNTKETPTSTRKKI